MVAVQTRLRGRPAAVEAYLPSTLIDRWASSPSADPLWSEWLDGSLMHCDISGFTAMSESLAALGGEGAELMAGVLNHFFDTMLSVAARWAGTQLKFGGDAMLLFFAGGEGAARAAACGLEMQRSMREFQSVPLRGQTYELRMRIGVHSSRFLSLSSGQNGGLLHYLLTGADVNRTAAVEPLAAPGQVVVSAQSAALIAARARLAATRGGVWRVHDVYTSEPAPHRRKSVPPPVDVLRRYVLAPLSAALDRGSGRGLPAEHRRATVMFVNLLGASTLLHRQGEQETLRQVDAYVKLLLTALERHGGFLLGSDVAEEGDKFIALFGAPISHERDEASALRCALDLERGLGDSGLELRQRIGVNTGGVFAGEIGSSLRREYTVIGDAVNTAARLMAAARPGQTIVSLSTTQRAGGKFELRRMRPLRVKGKRAPIAVSRLVGGSRATLPLEATALAPLVGRDAELAALLRLARKAPARRGRWAFISGEAGIGKSRLVSEAAWHLRFDGWRDVVATCQPHLSRSPYSMWIEPIGELLGVPGGAAPQMIDARVRSEVARLCPELKGFAPLVGELLGLPEPDDALLRALDAKTRRDRLSATVVATLLAAARERPLLIRVDDAHLADEPSLELLGALLGHAEPSLFVCVTSRGEAPPEAIPHRPNLSLHLRALDAGAARQLVEAARGAGAHDLEAVVARAHGNPLFLQELARDRNSRANLPENIHDVLLARIDGLPADERRMLRLASVVGPAFALPIVQSLATGDADLLPAEPLLLGLVGAGFLSLQGDGARSYAFAHVLARDAVYETLPYAERRRLHRGAGEYVEREHAGQLEPVCQSLLHHYESAEDDGKIVFYAAMAGDRAASVFANREAIAYYERAASALDHRGGRAAGDSSALAERIGDCLEAAGSHRDAVQSFSDALARWHDAGARARTRLVRPEGDLHAREAALCRKVAVAHERSSNYEASLEWLDRAVAALPRRPGRTASQVSAARSVSLFRKGLYREAIAWGTRALALARRGGQNADMAYAHNMLANSFIETGALRQAIRHLELAVRLYDDLGDVRGQASAHNNIASCFQLLGNLDAALHHYRLALDADRLLGNEVHEAIVHNNMGEVLLMLGRLDSAVDEFEAVGRAYRDHPDLAALAGLAEVNVCRYWLACEQPAQASQHLRRGMALLRRVGAKGLILEAQIQQAELRLAQGRATDAAGESRRAVASARDLDAKLLEARAERVLGAAYATVGDAASATAHLRASEALARQAGAGLEQARALVGQARVAAGAGRPAQARTRLARAIGIFTVMGVEPDLQEAQRLLAAAG